MKGIPRRLRKQGGQAMLEYSLISATVVVAFAAASQMGFSDVFLHYIDNAQSTYNIQLLPDEVSPEAILKLTKTFNQQLPLQ
ncbi:MAG: hypothetical protein ACR2MY_10745 [Candidatus Dormibacteria bacterium]